jgi:hypothetical protein
MPSDADQEASSTTIWAVAWVDLRDSIEDHTIVRESHRMRLR